MLLQALLLTWAEMGAQICCQGESVAPQAWNTGTQLRRESLIHSSDSEAELPSPRFLGRSECPAMCSAPPGALFWANSSATCLAGFLVFCKEPFLAFCRRACAPKLTTLQWSRNSVFILPYTGQTATAVASAQHLHLAGAGQSS